MISIVKKNKPKYLKNKYRTIKHINNSKLKNKIPNHTKFIKQSGGTPDLNILQMLSSMPFDDYGEYMNPIYGILWAINLLPNYYKFMCDINVVGKLVKVLFTSPVFNEIVPSKLQILGKLTPKDIGSIIADMYIAKCIYDDPSVKKPKPKTQKRQADATNIKNCIRILPQKLHNAKVIESLEKPIDDADGKEDTSQLEDDLELEKQSVPEKSVTKKKKKSESITRKFIQYRGMININEFIFNKPN